MLFIHCGLHKTGSTAIQNAFNKPYRDFIFSKKSYDELNKKVIDEKWSAAVKDASRHKNIILSSEFALGTYKNQYHAYKERLNRLKQVLPLRSKNNHISA